MQIDTIIAKTIEYLAVPAVVGHEFPFLMYLKNDFERLGYNTSISEGVLAVYSDEDPYNRIISAHLDRHGLISIGEGEYAYAAQYMKEIKYGEVNNSSQKELNSIKERFEGEVVFAYDSKSGKWLGQGQIQTCQACLKSGDAVFHVPHMKHLEQNTPLAYARSAKEEGEYFKGQIDNAISLGTMYAVLKEGYKGTFLLTAEEEIGKSWVNIARWLEEMDMQRDDLIILDTSPYKTMTIIDQGALVLRRRDKSGEFNTALVDKLAQRCQDLEIPYQIKDEALLAEGKQIKDLGSTELGRLVLETEGKWSGATVQIPTVLYHTSNETTSRACIRNYYNFLRSAFVTDPLI